MKTRTLSTLFLTLTAIATWTTSAALASQKMIGFFDGIQGDSLVMGWTLDQNAPTLPQVVELWMDGGPSNGGVWLTTAFADLPRPDLTGVNSNHAYQFRVPTGRATDGRVHSLSVYVFDAGVWTPLQVSKVPAPPTQFAIDSVHERQVFQRELNPTAQTPVVARGMLDYSTALSATIKLTVTDRLSGSILSQNVQNILIPETTEGINANSKFSVPYAAYAATLYLPTGGWYSMSAELDSATAPTPQTVHLDKFGVGELFITAGQSNSVSSANDVNIDCRTTPKDDRISAYDVFANTWRVAADPQPQGADTGLGAGEGAGGSAWPTLGDLLITRLNMPIGFISVGSGGSNLGSWLPTVKPSLYSGLRRALNSLKQGSDETNRLDARAILWHQGEAEIMLHAPHGMFGYDYFNGLFSVISHLIQDTGEQIPWMVANVAYVPPTLAKSDPAEVAGLRAGQALLWQNGTAYQGPDTDTLGPEFRSGNDHIHMNLQGVAAHARLWCVQIMKEIYQQADPCN